MENLGYTETEAENRNKRGLQAVEDSQLHRRSVCARSIPPEPEKAVTQVALQQNIGFFSCVGILVGGIIGSGIFISPKGVLLGSGSIGLALIIWLVCGVISMIGSLAFAELGSFLPNSGGQYFYMIAAFDPKRKEKRSMWRSLIPFLYFWQFIWLSKPAGTVVQGMACASYLMKLFALSGCEPDISKEDRQTFVRLIAAVFILLIAAINCYSNKISTKIINAFTLIKLLAVFFVIGSGFVSLAEGTNEALNTGFEGTTFTPDGLVTAFYSGFWAYAGWDNLNLVTRELKNPKRDLFRSLVFTCVLVTVVYMLANVAYFIVLPKDLFLSSNAVAVDFADKIVGRAGAVYIIASVTCSIFGSSFGSVFTTARLAYAAAREGHMVDILSYIHYQRMTPTASIIFSTIISFLILPHSSILGLIAVTGFIDWVFMFLTMVALVILKRNRKVDEDHVRVPVVVPYIMMFFSLVLIVTPFVRNPQMEYVFAIIILFSGVIPYAIFVYHDVTVPGLNTLRQLVQKILLVLPPEDEEI